MECQVISSSSPFFVLSLSLALQNFICSYAFSSFSSCPYPPVCPLIFLFCAGCCWTFSTCTLLCSSPTPSFFGPLVAPALQCPSGPLTGCCSAFPANRATGKRPSTALFDVPSPLIHYTWTVLGTDFVLNRSTTISLAPSLHLVASLLYFQSLYVFCCFVTALMISLLLKLCNGEKYHSIEAHKADV